MTTSATDRLVILRLQNALAIATGENAKLSLQHQASARGFKKYRRKLRAREDRVSFLKSFIFEHQLHGALHEKEKQIGNEARAAWLDSQRPSALTKITEPDNAG